VISAGTAADLVETLRAIVRTARAVQHGSQDPELPASSVGLLALLEQDGEQRLGQLADRLAVDPSVVSRQVMVLEQSGWALRRPDPGDGRAHLLTITAEGRATLERYRARWAQWLGSALADWDDDEAQDVVARLRRLLHDVVQQAQPTRPGQARATTPARTG
jgi:DNA-binding MarR family transcriptional regulator